LQCKIEHTPDITALGNFQCTDMCDMWARIGTCTIKYPTRDTFRASSEVLINIV
jgi:hypothetical protein